MLKTNNGDKSMFASLTPTDGGFVTFGDNSKGKIIVVGNIGKEPSPINGNIFLVYGLKYNLLSIVNYVTRERKLHLTIALTKLKESKMTKYFLLA